MTTTSRNLKVAPLKMERIEIELSLKDHIMEENLRQRTSETDIIQHVSTPKWNIDGNVARMKNDRWTKGLLG